MKDQEGLSKQMMTMLTSDDKWADEIRENPIEGMKNLEKEAKKQMPAFYTDRSFYKVAIWSLALLALITAIGSLILALYDTKTPEVLVSLGSASVGALVGLFAPSPSEK